MFQAHHTDSRRVSQRHLRHLKSGFEVPGQYLSWHRIIRVTGSLSNVLNLPYDCLS